jgi:serine/threonine-protein kinase
VTGPDAQAPIHSGELQVALGERYAIERVIARGGMAIVYLAHDRELDRKVAVKLLDPERSSQLSAERFLREVRITAQLQHPNILPLIDSGRVDGMAYAVMPFVEGESLRDLMRRTRVPLADALLWAREIAEALDYAHQRGIVHRDIKPENILLSNGQAVISDFGVAYARHMASQGALTGVGETLGTPAYMSPEQIRGEKVDGRSDLYSLGCMLYEMLSGRPPFDEPSVRKVLNQHLNSEPEPLAVRAPDVPERVVQLVKRAMAKSPADRFESTAAMAAALRRALGEPPRYATPSGPELAQALGGEPAGWRRFVPSGAMLWLVLLGAGLLALVLLLQRQQGPGPVAPRVPVSLAVLPPVAQPAGSVPPYLTEGLAGEVIAEIDRQRSVRITPQASSFAPLLAGLPASAVGESLGVTHVIATTVVPGNESYAATVRLLRTSDGAPTWQRTYQFGEGNLGRIAMEIGDDALAELMGGTVRGSGDPASTARPVLSSILEGRYWMARGTPEAMARARDAFTAALAVDSMSVEALAGLANTRIRTAQYGYPSAEDFYTSLALAIQEAERALALAPASGDARFVAARAARIAGLPRDSIIRLFESALDAAPNLTDALVDLAQLQGEAGNADSAIALASLAVRLNPLAPATRHGAMTAALRVRRYDFAIEQARARLAQDPGDLVALALEGLALSAAGRSDECVGRAFGPWLAAEATCLHAAGRTGEARAAADSLKGLLQQGKFFTVHQFTDLGTYYAWTGNSRESLVWIGRAAERTPLLIDWVFTSGLYDRVLRDRAFVGQLAGLRQEMRARLEQRRAAGRPTPTTGGTS